MPKRMQANQRGPIPCDKCPSLSKFHGFGLDLCWSCYHAHMKIVRGDNKPIDAVGQMGLDFDGVQTVTK